MKLRALSWWPNPLRRFAGGVRGHRKVASAVMKTNVYIDGYNLFYGSLVDSPRRWLDVADLAQKLAPQDQIDRVRYFTAHITARPGSNGARHQQVYLRALATLPLVSIHLGHFLTTKKWARVVNPPPPTAYVYKTEEKGSDVNLATYLLVDGFKGEFDKALVVSNDSDLCEPIRVVTKMLGLTVGVYNPHIKNPSVTLRSVASFMLPLRKGIIASCPLPNTLTDAQGTITRPANWY